MYRRRFLGQLSTVGAAAVFGGFLNRAKSLENNSRTSQVHGYGELIPTTALNENRSYVALPKGFKYKVIGKAGSLMTDGRITPRLHDGMSTFQDNGELRIVRNHEINDNGPKDNVTIGSDNHYDETAGGGTTTLTVDPRTREIIRDHVSLSGTLNNCAGGATPWGSWISCEETTFGQTKFIKEGYEVGGFAKPHGYCFEVLAWANKLAPAVPLKAMGRFVHEAIAVDRKTGIVYQTEDNTPAGFYRFLPNRPGQLQEGGTLQVLAITNKPNCDMSRGQNVGSTFQTHWLKINDPDPPEADVDSIAVFKQGTKDGTASFSRLEGCFASRDGSIYFVSTNGAESRGGQIWLFQPTDLETGRLSLLFQSPGAQILDMPDNICLHPKNKHLFICEDSDYGLPGTTPENYIRILTPDGKLANFAKNITLGKETSEFAGSTFTQDGKTLFVNIQAAGVTLAIWGDWGNFRN